MGHGKKIRIFRKNFWIATAPATLAESYQQQAAIRRDQSQRSWMGKILIGLGRILRVVNQLEFLQLATVDGRKKSIGVFKSHDAAAHPWRVVCLASCCQLVQQLTERHSRCRPWWHCRRQWAQNVFQIQVEFVQLGPHNASICCAQHGSVNIWKK